MFLHLKAHLLHPQGIALVSAIDQDSYSFYHFLSEPLILLLSAGAADHGVALPIRAGPAVASQKKSQRPGTEQKEPKPSAI